MEIDKSCSQLEVEALVAAVRALEALAHERTVARLKQESDDGLATTSHHAHMHQSRSLFALPYDPASVFLLETMVSIAGQTPRHIEELW
jgi:brefeldin A-resistance guanine nucleotide exchange factor 1